MLVLTLIRESQYPLSSRHKEGQIVQHMQVYPSIGRNKPTPTRTRPSRCGKVIEVNHLRLMPSLGRTPESTRCSDTGRLLPLGLPSRPHNQSGGFPAYLRGVIRFGRRHPEESVRRPFGSV